MSARRADAVVFDLGGVLVDWDPRRLYRTLLGSDEEIAEFFDEVDFAAWNHALDAGERTWAEAVADHATRFPHRRELLAAYPDRFPETIGGVIDGTVRLVEELHGAGVRLLALTNWSAELFPHDLDPAGTVFVDDREVNVEAARAAGMTGVVFTDPDQLRRDLARAGVSGLRRTG